MLTTMDLKFLFRQIIIFNLFKLPSGLNIVINGGAIG
jgi:hypothetical protein